MEPKILAAIFASKYRKEILLILADEHLDTPSEMVKKMLKKGYKSANMQNLSANLRWLKNHGLIKVEVERRKGKLYKITNEGKKYAIKFC